MSDGFATQDSGDFLLQSPGLSGSSQVEIEIEIEVLRPRQTGGRCAGSGCNHIWSSAARKTSGRTPLGKSHSSLRILHRSWPVVLASATLWLLP